MTIEEKVNQVLTDRAGSSSDPDFERLCEFYEEKKKAGLIRKQEYTLPPMDTVGRTVYRRGWNEE